MKCFEKKQRNEIRCLNFKYFIQSKSSHKMKYHFFVSLLIK